MTTAPHIRWEVWIGEWDDDGELRWRFNACFDERHDAESEREWYLNHDYGCVEIRCRTTRFQQRRHVTTGSP